MFEVKVNKSQFKIDFESKSQVSIDGESTEIDIADVSSSKYHVIKDNISYNVEVVEVDLEKKVVKIKVNNNSYDVAIKDKFDLLLSKLGMSNLTAKKVKDVKAPMPGLVVDVVANVGDKVNEGDSLLILEAMKMENVLKSPIEGVIKSISVKPTETVEKNQLLVSFE